MSAGASILVVDDDEGSRYGKSRLLRSQGFQVSEADCGEAALRAIEQAPPDLVLLDVKLPGIDGIETCRRIKQSWPGIFVVHTSAAYKATADRIRGLNGGADGYLAEPIEASELLASVRALLRIRAVEAELRQALETNQMLLREVQHRTMNNLQLATSFLDLEARRVTDPSARERFKAATQRIRALATLHSHLYRRGKIGEVDFGAYLTSLLEDIGAANSGSKVRFELDVAPQILSADRALNLGLVVNELVTNALKYAFAGRATGTVTVALKPAADGRVALSIADDGIGFQTDAPSGSARSGLNIATMLAAQSSAELSREPSAGGTHWRLLLQP